MPATYHCPLRARSQTDVQQLVLEMPPGFDFNAGQYVEVIHPAGAIPLSIASGPRRLPELHLHYRSTPGVREAAWMDELLESAGPLKLRGPLGSVRMPDSNDLPLLLIAGGTGIAQARAILDELALVSARAPVTLLWCADRSTDLYCQAELEALSAAWLSLESIVDPQRDTQNAGLRRLANIARGITERGARAMPWTLLAGAPAFVYAAFDLLVGAGVDRARIHSDVFAYAPRLETDQAP